MSDGGTERVMDAEERARLRENADIWIDDPLEPALATREQVLDLLLALDTTEARVAMLRERVEDLEVSDAVSNWASDLWKQRSDEHMDAESIYCIALADIIIDMERGATLQDVRDIALAALKNARAALAATEPKGGAR